MNKCDKPTIIPIPTEPQTHWRNIIHCQRCGQQWVHYSSTHTNTLTEHYTQPEVWSAVGPLFQYPHKYRQSITHCQRCGQQWVHYSSTHTNTDRALHTARGVVSSESIIPIPTQIQTEHYTLPEVWSAVGPLFQYPHKYRQNITHCQRCGQQWVHYSNTHTNTDRTLHTARGVVSSGSSARGGGWPFSPQPIKGVGPILSPCAVVTVEVASNTSLSCAEIKAMF